MPSADSRCVIISPCGLITLWFYRLRPCFVCPALLARLINDWGVQPFDAGIIFFLPVLSHFPVAYNDSPFETQRTSRGKPRLLSAHDCQIYLASPCDGYRTLSCVADSSRPPPASSACPLPDRYGAYLYVNPRFCLRLPSGAPCGNTLALDYPSAPSAWIWTLRCICVKIPPASPISSWTSPAHNQALHKDCQR